MQYFKTTGNEAIAWKKMGTDLLIDASWVDLLRKDGNDLRHGAAKDVEGDHRKKLLFHAWRVVDRFALYLANQERPLNQNQYPKLTI
jgi:hypothetical protein